MKGDRPFDSHKHGPGLDERSEDGSGWVEMHVQIWSKCFGVPSKLYQLQSIVGMDLSTDRGRSVQPNPL